MAEGAGRATVQVTVVVCVAARTLREWTLELPVGATAADALRASGADALLPPQPACPTLGIWGRVVRPDTPLVHLDRVEVYRPLQIDPKTARRERFARQGARAAGLFARPRPGGDRPD
ncbi:RnfH family protein [Verminephrobacter aporrectodeae]|uniref:RnfH family protein n=1 Tax=Verminephrobacter aporrectodeae TaxID=1110389 RepID=UPI002243CAE9|nr:RnfH family protein [Verminephrobacter aporrectodeae]MCW8175635.1 RnfH family protein [Verminephrobacter aporrectodeae subsp. tuberculatae]MCW8203220.1 RnfH family protein [Verminephrobacter aporrectodeae subsp. tuberculatae]